MASGHHCGNEVYRQRFRFYMLWPFSYTKTMTVYASLSFSVEYIWYAAFMNNLIVTYDNLDGQMLKNIEP